MTCRPKKSSIISRICSCVYSAGVRWKNTLIHFCSYSVFQEYSYSGDERLNYVCVCVWLMLQEGYREEASSLFPPSPYGETAPNLTSVHVTKTSISCSPSQQWRTKTNTAKVVQQSIRSDCVTDILLRYSFVNRILLVQSNLNSSHSLWCLYSNVYTSSSDQAFWLDN